MDQEGCEEWDKERITAGGPGEKRMPGDENTQKIMESHGRDISRHDHGDLPFPGWNNLLCKPGQLPLLKHKPNAFQCRFHAFLRKPAIVMKALGDYSIQFGMKFFQAWNNLSVQVRP